MKSKRQQAYIKGVIRKAMSLGYLPPRPHYKALHEFAEGDVPRVLTNVMSGRELVWNRHEDTLVFKFEKTNSRIEDALRDVVTADNPTIERLRGEYDTPGKSEGE